MMKRKNFVSHERLLKAMESTSEDARRLKDEYPYAVVVTYSFDSDVGVFPCCSEDKAKELLKRLFESEVAEDKANGNDAESALSEDGWSATITNFRRDGSVDHTWWKIGTISGEGDDFV